uniref:Uncharacterized protein n=1 Tax=Arundo donax TaxID=35708 RepID=A0A0A9DNA8_ARUDO
MTWKCVCFRVMGQHQDIVHRFLVGDRLQVQHLKSNRSDVIHLQLGCWVSTITMKCLCSLGDGSAPGLRYRKRGGQHIVLCWYGIEGFKKIKKAIKLSTYLFVHSYVLVGIIVIVAVAMPK